MVEGSRCFSQRVHRSSCTSGCCMQILQTRWKHRSKEGIINLENLISWYRRLGVYSVTNHRNLLQTAGRSHPATATTASVHIFYEGLTPAVVLTYERRWFFSYSGTVLSTFTQVLKTHFVWLKWWKNPWCRFFLGDFYKSCENATSQVMPLCVQPAVKIRKAAQRTREMQLCNCIGVQYVLEVQLGACYCPCLRCSSPPFLTWFTWS